MNSHFVRNVFALISVLLLNVTALGDDPKAEPWRKPDPAALKRWQDMRFGMFIHWGPVSLTHQEIGWSRGAQTPIKEYDNLYKKFNPVKFNADEWVRIAKAAGMKYMILTTKHHDGFCMFATKETDYNIMNSPFGRDVTKELADACRKQGIAFGTYYSVCDWHHPDFPFTSPGGSVRREKSDLDAYNRYLLAQIRELITNCGPLLTIWNDVPQAFQGRGVQTIKMVRELQPDILVNNRTGDGGDYDTPEQRIGGFNLDRPWESCMTISAHNQWAWGGPKDGVKPLVDCLLMLVRGAGGNGNVLLNVGPTPEGVIEPIQVERLKEIGAWLAKYGESIYGTRGGPYKPTKSLASTRKNNTVYIHITGWPEETVVLPPLPARIVKTRALTGGRASVKQSEAGIEISVPKADRQEIDTIVALDLDKPAIEIAPIAVNPVGESLTTGKRANASNVYQNNAGHDAAKAIDDDEDTRWATDADVGPCWLEVDLGKPRTFDRALILECIDFGVRVKAFELQYQDGKAWKTFFHGSGIGKKLEAKFEPVTARVVRLNITAGHGGPTITEFQLFPPAQKKVGHRGQTD
ncbi:MAG: alpha-L-fucosidase [Isosphaeraceae bacterium]